MGCNESLADLPEYAQLKAAGVDCLGRYLEYTPDIKILAVAEENLLDNINKDMYGTESQVLRVFAKGRLRCHGYTSHRVPNGTTVVTCSSTNCVYSVWTSASTTSSSCCLARTWKELGKWKGTVAVHNRVEYWTEGLMAYFDAVGQGVSPNDTPRPITTREALKDYDPGLYQLVDETMAYEGKVDWRYQP